MARDFFEDYGLRENRADTVERHLGRIGLTLRDSGTSLAGAAVDAPTKPLPLVDERDGFAPGVPGGVMISPTLAKMLGVRDDDAR